MKLYQATVTVEIEHHTATDAKLEAALAVVRSELAYAFKTIEHRLSIRLAADLSRRGQVDSAVVKVTATE